MTRFFKFLTTCIVAFGLMVTTMNLLPTCRAVTISIQPQQTPATSKSPFACKTSAYTPKQKARKGELDNQFRRLAIAYRELPNGYAFQFPAEFDAIKDLAEWIALERLCCPFFTFDLVVEAEVGPLWLNLTGRDGVKQFIAMEFQPAFSKLPAK